jgi:hypothetical protein
VLCRTLVINLLQALGPSNPDNMFELLSRFSFIRSSGKGSLLLCNTTRNVAFAMSSSLIGELESALEHVQWTTPLVRQMADASLGVVCNTDQIAVLLFCDMAEGIVFWSWVACSIMGRHSSALAFICAQLMSLICAPESYRHI